MDVCTECKLNITNNSDAVFCDSCNRSFHKKPCSALNASEIKVMELKGSRQLRFFCKDCQKGFLQVPALMKAVDDLRQEVEALKNSAAQVPIAPLLDTDHRVTSTENDNTILIELQERQKRASNVMLFNVPEGNNDSDEVKSVFRILSGDPPSILHVSRVGKGNVNNIRALKVTLSSPNDAHTLVKNGYKLKGKKLYINFDLTAKQRELDKKLSLELKARKDKGESVAIRYRNGYPQIIQKKN